MTKQVINQNSKLENQRVFKDNTLISAKYSLTLAEQRVLNALLAQITAKSDNNLFRFKVSELADVCKFDKDSAYSQVKKLCIRLRTRSIYISDGKGYLVTGWINSAQCENGIVEFEVDKKLMPYFQAISNFTVLNLLEINMFKCMYTQRIYEWLLYAVFQGNSLVLTIEEIKMRLKLDGRYKDYKNFRRKVLEPAISEISAYTTLMVSYDAIKEGKAISAVAFSLSYPNCLICKGRGLVLTSDSKVVICKCHPMYIQQQQLIKK